MPEALEGFTAVKAGIDMLRAALSLVKDAKGALSPEKAAAVTAALDASEKQMAIAEAQIARGLGFTLHHCEFPPPIMLDIGYRRDGARVFECPSCGASSAGPYSFTRTRHLDGSSLRTVKVAPEKPASAVGVYDPFKDLK